MPMSRRNEVYMACDLSADFNPVSECIGRPLARRQGGIRTIARWKSGLLPLEVFAMRVNWDTQRISPCISLTFAFHMSPEGLENAFRDSLHGHLTLAAADSES